MSRPFFNDSIVTLEGYFEERKTDEAFLKLLVEELSFRSSEKARKLRLRVEEMLQHEDLGFSSLAPQTISAANELLQVTLADYQKYSGRPDINIPITNIPSNILSSWIALEVLSPQTFRKPQDLAGASGSIVHFNKPLLPWEGPGEKSKPNYRLYYQVVLGTIEFEKAISALLNIYADKRVDRPAPKGEAILAVVVVDKSGRLVEDPAVGISSFAWGVPQALKGDLRSLSGWTDAENILRETLDKILRKTDEEGEELPLDAATIQQARQFLISTLQLPAEFITNSLFAVRTYEYYTSSGPPEPLLLNSFFINDLITAKNLHNEGKASVDLQLYIGNKLQNNRKDLLHDRQALEKAISPAMMSPARWPGPGRHPLVVLQQAAVNLALKELKTDGILAVNGPPGTGKTTLLRDVVAGVVTSRAEAMCAFNDPADAFSNSGERISAGQAWLTFYQLDKKLQGFELLIASSNNKAVENVSAELPGLKAIAHDANDLRYFKCLSDILLERESWGLVAAVLGNATNRSRFKQYFWWDKEVGLSTYLAEAAGTPQFVDVLDEKTGKIIGTRKPKIISEENAPSGHDVALERWKEAKYRFQTALARSDSTLSALEKIREIVVSISVLEQEASATQDALSLALSNEASTKASMESLELVHKDLEEQSTRAKRDLADHQILYPGFFASLFRTRTARLWKKEHSVLKEKHKEAARQSTDSYKSFAEFEKMLPKSTQMVGESRNALIKVSQKLSKAKRDIDDARIKLGTHIIDGDFFVLSHEQKHLVSPWCDKTVQLLRDEVFIEAVRLHKAFLDAAAKPIRHNLGILMMIFSGRTLPDEKKQKLLPDLWSSLFLVVPSVSTTFASVERMLGKLPPESLGWLLIDEAGQALPQAAVGALMRTKRAVVVGDPIQIEPVVTLPDTLTQNICRQFGVDPNRFNAPEASAQTLADTATAYFAEFDGRNGSRSVGVPLLVHRRCEDPMFGISNAIAYERLMVQAKKAGKSAIRDFLGASRWIDIQGQAQEKWCPEEGEIVLDILQRLKKAGIVPDLYIVTPFVIVQDNLRKLIRDSGVLQGWVESDVMWPFERIGTVHTVQGREAEAVIFVLGAPQPQQTGARGWAGGRPNLLNVAVTRAKEVLYVIGNRQLWSKAGLFSELSNRLP